MDKYKASILFTRPVDQQLVEKARAASINVVALPFISVASLPSEKILQSLSHLPKADCTVVFTSASAVDAIAGFKPDTSNWNVYCLSGGTLRSVRSCLADVTVSGVADDATALAYKIIEDKAIKEVHFFTGNLHLKGLPKILAEAGIEVHIHEVYNTILTPSVITEDFDGIAFFSPSAVESFFSVNQTRKETILFAVGALTAASLQSQGNEVVISPAPDQAILADHIIEYFNSKHNKIKD
jgi:uroporphyrinogen-III synthase